VIVLLQPEYGRRVRIVTGVQTCALPISEAPGVVPAGTSETSGAPSAPSAETEGADRGEGAAEPDGHAQDTTVISCRVPTAVADELVARARARNIHPQQFLADLIDRSLETE